MRFRSSAVLALSVSLTLPAALGAQDMMGAGKALPTAGMIGAELGRTLPGVMSSTPIGFGMGSGDVFIGSDYRAKSGSAAHDAGLYIGAGLGDARGLFGFEAVLNSSSVIGAGFGSGLTASAKIHKVLGNYGFAVGVDNLNLNADDPRVPSFYAAGTRSLHIRDGSMFTDAIINVGMGNGRFQWPSDYLADETIFTLFLSSTLRVNSHSAAVVEYASSQINLSLTIAPVKDLPLFISPTLLDVAGENGNAGRLALGAGLKLKF
jgi:hypothetical protein